MDTEELRARRDRIYSIVESGAIYAQIVAQNARAQSHAGTTKLPEDIGITKPSAEAQELLKLLLSKGSKIDAIARKVALLGKVDRAILVDSVLSESKSNINALEVLGQLVPSETLTSLEKGLILEQATRSVTLFGTIALKTALLENFDDKILRIVSEDLRVALFEDIIAVVKSNQFHEVNILVPVLVDHTEDIPTILQKDYVLALVNHSRSSAFKGAPAASRAVSDLPDEMVKATLPSIDREFLSWHGAEPKLRGFINRCEQVAKGKQKRMIRDAMNLKPWDFDEKYPREK